MWLQTSVVRAQPQAESQPKPSPNRPSWAQPWQELHGSLRLFKGQSQAEKLRLLPYTTQQSHQSLWLLRWAIFFPLSIPFYFLPADASFLIMIPHVNPFLHSCLPKFFSILLPAFCIMIFHVLHSCLPKFYFFTCQCLFSYYDPLCKFPSFFLILYWLFMNSFFHSHCSISNMSTLAMTIRLLIKEIHALSNSLSDSVPEGSKDNKIWSVMNTEECNTPHKTFNQWFDAMFIEQ